MAHRSPQAAETRDVLKCPKRSRFGRTSPCRWWPGHELGGGGSIGRDITRENLAELRGVARRCAESRQTAPNVTSVPEWADEVARLRRVVLRFVTTCYVR